MRAEPSPTQPWRTTIIFSELGADHPGALVDALYEISNREVNMTRIESRPRRFELGRYMFFIDLEGADTDPPVAEAIGALRNKAENVRVWLPMRAAPRVQAPGNWSLTHTVDGRRAARLEFATNGSPGGSWRR